MSEFYSYMWLREDGTPYYVGKGTGNRAFKRHYGFCAPKDRSRILVLPMESEVLALESEKALIELFGRKDNGTGCLRNHNDGGAGPREGNTNAVGRKSSTEWRRRQSKLCEGNQFAKGKTWQLSDETRKRQSRARLIHPNGKLVARIREQAMRLANGA